MSAALPTAVTDPGPRPSGQSRRGPSRPPAVPVGEVEVTVPATSANLGPGFDALGLALDVRDRVLVRAAAPAMTGLPATTCEVHGEGEGEVPTDGGHLVAATVRGALAELLPGAPAPDLHLVCHNEVPHGRGLGSSAAAIAAGLAAAWRLAGGGGGTGPGSDDDGDGAGREPDGAGLDWLVDRSSAIEGHGDNAAAAVLGGAVVAWHDGAAYRASALDVDPGLEIVSAVPEAVLLTSIARAILPPEVPRGDAVFTAARTALLVQALAGRRDLLLPATEDRLHQDLRGPAMPPTHDLLQRLRERGIAAVVSGAGPSLLVLGTPADEVAGLAGPAWHVRAHRLGHGLRLTSP